MGEPFKIEPSEDIRQFLGDCGIEDDFYNTEFCIFENELIMCNSYGHTYNNYSKDVFISVIVGGILNGLITIKRKKCKPKDGDEYYYVDMIKDEYDVVFAVYTESYSDLMNFMHGNCFKTREEAAAKAEEIYEVFREKLKEAEEIEYI